MPPADEHILSLWRELKHIRFQARFLEWAAAARALHRSLRDYDEVVRRYSPDQPRIPAGQTGGGRWVDWHDLANPRRVIAARYPNATPAQRARLVAAQAQASQALARVRERDPLYRPRAGVYETIEGETEHYRRTAEAADAHLPNAPQRDLLGLHRGIWTGGARADTPSEHIVAPFGLGPGRNPGPLRDGIVTVRSNEFGRMLGELGVGAEPVDRADYRGQVFQRRDGFMFGVRQSDGSGWTLDFFNARQFGLRFHKVHYQ